MALQLVRALFLVLALVSADFAEPLLPTLVRSAIADDPLDVEDDAVLVRRSRFLPKPASRPARPGPVHAAGNAGQAPPPPRPVAIATVQWLLPLDRRPVLADPVTTAEDH